MKDRLLIGLLLATVILAYGNTLVNQFTMDDEIYVVRNPQVTNSSLKELFFPNQISNVFRPVTFATYAMNWALSADDPLPYHLFNLILHAGVTWLLYLLLQILFGNLQEAKTIAFAGALIFAVHPIHTEAVSSVVGRAELLAAGFLIAAWILHLRDREIPALLCFALALLSKESAVAFFPLVWIGDYAMGKWKPRRSYALIAGMTLLYLGLLWKVQGGRFGQASISVLDNPLAHIPAGWRILNALRVAWKYIALHFYPAVLSCDYSFHQIPVYLDLRHTIAAALATAAAIAVWIWAIRKRQSGLILAGGVYLAGFAATANILVPTGTIMAERLAYLPSVGFCVLPALGWSWLEKRQKMIAWAVLAVVVMSLTVRTVMRNRDWKDNLALYSAAVRAVPNDAKMHSNLGGQYMARNELDLARAEFQEALRINPDYPDALAFGGLLESWKGNYQAAGAMMEKALNMSGRDNPNYDLIVINFAAILIHTNHIDGALELLNQEIAESPRQAQAWSTRAVIHYKRGEVASARDDADAALRLNPADPQAQSIMQLLDAPATATPSR